MLTTLFYIMNDIYVVRFLRIVSVIVRPLSTIIDSIKIDLFISMKIGFRPIYLANVSNSSSTMGLMTAGWLAGAGFPNARFHD
jgi:hypothetical protein